MRGQEGINTSMVQLENEVDKGARVVFSLCSSPFWPWALLSSRPSGLGRQLRFGEVCLLAHFESVLYG